MTRNARGRVVRVPPASGGYPGPQPPRETSPEPSGEALATVQEATPAVATIVPRRRWSRRWRPGRRPPTQPPLQQRVCVLCGAPFLARRPHARMCSALCRKRLERARRREREEKRFQALLARFAQESPVSPR
jgi:predicted nucleic acid-binding Zn ribbon protein